MNKIIFIFFFLINSFLITQSSPIKVEFSSKKIALNDLLTLKITIKNLREEDMVISTLDFNNLGRYSFQNQISILNGKITQKKILHYKLKPLKVGTGKIKVIIGKTTRGPFRVEITAAKKNLKSNPPNTPTLQSPNNSFLNNFFNQQSPPTKLIKDVFIRNKVSKKKLKLNELAILNTYLYFRIPPQNILQKRRFNYLGINLIPQDIELKSLETEKINGITYQKKLIEKNLLYPYKTGEINIANGIYQISSRLGFFSSRLEWEVEVPKITLIVEDHVDPPANSYNHWGDFNLKVEFPKTKIDVNSPLTFFITISGIGNFKTIFPFSFISSDLNLKIRSGSHQENIKLVNEKFKGEKKLEYFLTTDQAGQYQLPTIEFNFYSPTQKDFVYIQQVLPKVEFTGEKTTLNEKAPPNQPLAKNNLEEIKFFQNNLTNNIFKKETLFNNIFFQHLFSLILFLNFWIFRIFFLKLGRGKKRFNKKQKLTLIKNLKQTIKNKKKSKKEKIQESMRLLNYFLNQLIPFSFISLNHLEEKLRKGAPDFYHKNKINKNLVYFLIKKIKELEEKIYTSSSQNLNDKNQLHQLVKELKKN